MENHYAIVYQTNGPAYYLSNAGTFVGFMRAGEARVFASRDTAERRLRLLLPEVREHCQVVQVAP